MAGVQQPLENRVIENGKTGAWDTAEPSLCGVPHYVPRGHFSA